MSKFIYAGLLVALLISCKADKDENHVPKAKPAVTLPAVASPVSLVDIEECQANFIILRNLFVAGNVQKLKAYFQFPIAHSELWNLAALNNAPETAGAEVPFTETDFKKLYKYLFADDFINGLKEIDAGTLFNKGLFITPVVTKHNEKVTEDYFIEAEFKNKDRQLILFLNRRYSEGQDEYETAITYYFKLDDKCGITFEKVLLTT